MLKGGQLSELIKKSNLIFFIAGLLFLSVSTPAQTRRALVIGLGEQKDNNWAKINGDKDVFYVREMLEDANYKNITTLVNQQATKAGIVAAFRQLTRNCSKGDMVYVHFSGHGQLVTDINGDEADGWDEAWIPYDACLKYSKNDKGEKHLIDDEVYALLTDIRNKIGEAGKLIVVVDACHSGDSSRGVDVVETVRGVKDEFVIPSKKKGRVPKLPEQWLTLSACLDFQLNQEIKKPTVGKLTYALYSLSKDGDVSMDKIEIFMARYRSRLPQTPQQSGDNKTQKINDFLR